jgi:V/A-type H+-transporting ATPase subunit D
MEVFRLKRRLELATRGHKLLKDKLEALVRELRPLIPEYNRLVREVEQKIGRALRRFALAEAASQAGAVETAVRQNVQPVDVAYDREWYMGVFLPRFGRAALPSRYTYSFVETAADLDVTIDEMKELPPLLMELARLEHSLFVIATELERTRRRTNALEYVVIPEVKDSRKEVEQKIGELERSDVSRLMKVKEMLEEAERVRLGK